jgi:hypothetical protein
MLTGAGVSTGSGIDAIFLAVAAVLLPAAVAVLAYRNPGRGKT